MAFNNNTVAPELNNAVANLATVLTGGTDDATTIITLAGENHGATMEEANGDTEDLIVVGNMDADDEKDQEGEEESVVSAYTSSNYQTMNNSVLVAGSCAVNDPGVHVIVVEHVDEIHDYDQDIDGQEF
ncbi:hypothetical protein PR202_ga30187 [Eleusine coracana subsp. coracana]|uniref:Uncharacterized protein n=1 Tax=Eleusine coracana subsp. coracana TaxID=191504 RepID=A0AAV5DMT4_ELECO|nr:hypothetical protein QOZ80_4AG0328210 [Eleusine coracana subsp. coracana]GJN11949.1 hypothetical protein PR202_ga30187 [Eleusine coracana subsp. coracana]